MNTRNTTARHFTALGLAAVATLSMLASVQLLATPTADELQLARQSAPTQIVVIEASHSAKS